MATQGWTETASSTTQRVKCLLLAFWRKCSIFSNAKLQGLRVGMATSHPDMSPSVNLEMLSQLLGGKQSPHLRGESHPPPALNRGHHQLLPGLT